MRVLVLGEMVVTEDDGAPVTVPGAKERLLLAVLAAANPSVVSVDRLVDVLWAGDPPATARKSLQAHVVRLRTALEPDRPRGSSGRYVARRGHGYVLAVSRQDVDAHAFVERVARGRARSSSGDSAAAAEQLAGALELWRGEPYADWPDAPFADAERRRLVEVRASAVASLLEARLALGHHAEVVPELERLVGEDPLRERWWALLMLALYRDGRQADALAAGRRVRRLLAEEVGADPGPVVRQVETAILEQDPALNLPNQRVASPAVAYAGPSRGPPGTEHADTCPYMGLAAYQPSDAPLFRGRQRLVLRLVRSLVDAPVLVVSGPSGAGKSSLVRAGLVPALARGELPGSARWRTVILAPGRNAVDALADLTGDPPPDVPVLLVCDQLEELWAPGTDRAETRAFLDALLGLVEDGVVVRCVLVVRGDHVGRLAEHAALAETLAGSLMLVPPMTDPELREVVTEPARSVGLSVEPELVDVVVADVLGQAGALPLLSTALVGTWHRRRGNLLTLAGYLEAGGVAGALARSAESVFTGLPQDRRKLARQVLVRLADSTGPGVLVRRSVPLGELNLAGEGGTARREVVEVFVRERLLAIDDERVEVAHEALLSAWPRLARWLEDDAVGRAVRRRLAPAALEWQRSGKQADELYRGARLVAALDWASRPGTDLTSGEQSFLEASRQQAESDLTAAQQRAEKEARAGRRTRRLAAGLAAVLVVALFATGLAVYYQRDADARAREAETATVVADANRLAALSTTVGSLDLSLLLAAEGVRLAQTPDTEDGLLAALANHRRAVRVVPFAGQPQWVGLGGGGRSLFIAVGDRVVAWPVAATSLPRETVLATPDWEGWNSGAVSPVDGLHATAGHGEEAWLRVHDDAGELRLLLEGDVLGGSPLGIAFSADGRELLVAVTTAAPDEVGHLWRVMEIDVADGSVRPTGVEGTVADEDQPEATFAPDGESVTIWSRAAQGFATRVDLGNGQRTPLAVGGRGVGTEEVWPLPSGASAHRVTDGALELYDSAGRLVQVLDDPTQPVADLVMAPDGTWAATAGDSGAVLVWAVDTQTGRWSQREVLAGHDGGVAGVELDSAGRLLFTVGNDGTIIVWDMSADSGFGTSYPGLTGRWISNRPQVVEPGRLFVAPTRPLSRLPGAGQGPHADTLSVAATFIDPSTGEVVDQVDVGETVDGVTHGSSVAVSPDRKTVAVTSGLTTTVLDTGTREVLGEIVLPPTGAGGPDGSPLPAQLVWCAGWTPDGSRLLIGTAEGPDGSDGGGLAVVDPLTWQVERVVALPLAPQAIEASPDGELLAITAADNPHLMLVDAASLELERVVPVPGDELLGDLSFSPDGRQLAAAGLGFVQIFDTGAWEVARDPLKVHDDLLVQVEWTADGRTVVASSLDGTVSLFDVARGLVRARPLPASGDVGPGYSFVVPDVSDELITLAGEQPGRRYPMTAAQWLAEACSIVGRDLTPVEWSRYGPAGPHRATCTDLL